MDETKVMHGLDRENALRDVEPRHVLRESIVLDQHRHQVSSSQEFHDEVQIRWVLERIVQLHDPRRVGFGKHVAFRADVGELIDQG
jgi:hypothetical protein